MTFHAQSKQSFHSDSPYESNISGRHTLQKLLRTAMQTSIRKSQKCHRLQKSCLTEGEPIKITYDTKLRKRVVLLASQHCATTKVFPSNKQTLAFEIDD